MSTPPKSWSLCKLNELSTFQKDVGPALSERNVEKGWNLRI